MSSAAEKSPLRAILAANIKRLREHRKWSQAELTRRSGYTGVAMVESGDRGWPEPESVEAMAAALGVPVLYLLSDHTNRRHAALSSFLSTPQAAGCGIEEIVWLEQCRFDDREPDEQTYNLLHLAYQTTRAKNSSGAQSGAAAH